MCGICGIVRFDGNTIEPSAIAAATNSLRKRGPDHQETWIERDASAAFGAARLAVIDPSPTCNQPFADPSQRYRLVHNGAVYNFRELRRELESAGAIFRTEGDTEVVLAACARWGAAALGRLSGMWAIGFYDSQTKSGFVARDRFGIKPLIYCLGTARLSFASELRALRHLDSEGSTMDRIALGQLLRYGYIAAPATIFEGARRLPPGHFLAFSQRGADTPRPYPSSQESSNNHDDLDYSHATGELRRRIGDAVARQRVADVPLGAFLSGGLDSSIVVAHLSQASGRRVKTFSIGYADYDGYDETRYARLAAERFDTDHSEIVLGEADILAAIPRVLDHLDEPFGDSSIIPTSLVSAAARRQVTVALSGDGGDELFGGYWRYVGHATLESYLRVPRFLRRTVVEPMLARMSASKGSVAGNRLRQFRKLVRASGDDPIGRHLAWSRILAPEAEDLFTDPAMLDAVDAALVGGDFPREGLDAGDDELRRVMEFDLARSLPDDMLRKVDTASMMHSLEVRVPLLDEHVAEFARGLPTSWKIDRGMRKRILVDAYRGLIPDEILDRPKQGFEVPVGEYLRGPLREMFHDVVSRDAVESFGLLRHSEVLSIYEDHLERRGEHADLLFALLSLCWWRSKRN